MILIFTSIRRPLYKRDVLNVCCEPPDSQIQFAYQLKWIAEPLRGNPQGLNNQKALIVYCAETETQHVYKFYPVRQAIIADVTDESGFITLSLKLGQFFDYATYGDGVNEVIARFQRYVIETKTEHPNNLLKSATNEPKARFVREETEWDEAKYCPKWASLVRYVYDIKGLDDTVFFSVQDKSNFGGEPIPLFPNPANAEYPTSYMLKSGGSYTVSVFLMSGKRAVYKDPELKIKESVASVSGPFVRQRSSGFQADFDIQCKRSFDEERSMLTLRIPSEPNTFESPVADVLIRLSPRKGVLALAVTLLTVGGLFISLSPEVLGQIPVINQIKPTDWLSLVFKIVGVVMLGAGSYIGFRKLPSGAAS